MRIQEGQEAVEMLKKCAANDDKVIMVDEYAVIANSPQGQRVIADYFNSLRHGR